MDLSTYYFDDSNLGGNTIIENYVGSVSSTSSSGSPVSKQITIQNNGRLIIYAVANMLIRQYVTGSAAITYNQETLWNNSKSSTGWNNDNLFNGWKCITVKKGDIIKFNVTNGQASEGSNGSNTTITYYIAVIK